jgi:hypothetical protein
VLSNRFISRLQLRLKHSNLLIRQNQALHLSFSHLHGWRLNELRDRLLGNVRDRHLLFLLAFIFFFSLLSGFGCLPDFLLQLLNHELRLADLHPVLLVLSAKKIH